MKNQRGNPPPKLNMYEPAIYCLRIQGEIDVDWAEDLGARSMAVERDEAGCPVTALTTGPVDQAALVGMINYLNALGLPLVSVESLPAPVENELSEPVAA